ncbi:MAG: hypothetical protein ACOZAR_04970 [Patescibacteria group bacterium]
MKYFYLSSILLAIFLFNADFAKANSVNSQFRFECDEPDCPTGCYNSGCDSCDTNCGNYPCICMGGGPNTSGCIGYSINTSKDEYRPGENVSIYYSTYDGGGCNNYGPDWEDAIRVYLNNIDVGGLVYFPTGWWNYGLAPACSDPNGCIYNVSVGFRSCNGQSPLRNVNTVSFRVRQPNDYAPVINSTSPTNGEVKCTNRLRVGIYANDGDGATQLNSDFYNGAGTKIGDDDRWAGPGLEWFLTNDLNWNPGRNDWSASISDGKFSTSVSRYFVVNRNPSCSSVSGPTGVKNPGSYQFNMSTSDQDGNINNAKIVLSNGAEIDPGGYYSAPAGNYSYYGRVRDICTTSTCAGSNFRLNDVPSISVFTATPGCDVNSGEYYSWTVNISDQDNVSWRLYESINSGAYTQIYSSTQKNRQGTRSFGFGNKNIRLRLDVVDDYGASATRSYGPFTLNCSPKSPTDLRETVSCRNVNLSAWVEDPDGGNLTVTFSPNVTFTPSGGNVVNVSSGRRASVDLVLPMNSNFTWSVSATDNLSPLVRTNRGLSLWTNRTPFDKHSDGITYVGVLNPVAINLDLTQNPNSLVISPRFVIDYDKTGLGALNMDDYSTENGDTSDPSALNQEVKSRFYLDVWTLVNGSWVWYNVGYSPNLLDPAVTSLSSSSAQYSHRENFSGLYAGDWQYRATDTDKCGAAVTSPNYLFRVAPPVPINLSVNMGTAGCPICGNRNTAIVLDWDDVPYIQYAQSTSIGGGYRVDWSNDGGTTWRPVTKSLPDSTAGWTSDSRIVLVTDVLNLYDLSTSTVRNIRYRVASYSNGIRSNWLYSDIVPYNCEIPTGVAVNSGNSIELRADENSQPVNVLLTCRRFNDPSGVVSGTSTINQVDRARAANPNNSSPTINWTIVNLTNCSSGTEMVNNPVSDGTIPKNILHAGTNTTLSPCDGYLWAKLTNFGWSDVGINELNGNVYVAINPRATEEFNYSGEVISNPPPGFEKLDLPGVEK